MEKIIAFYITFNAIYTTLFVILVCGNEVTMTPWWITLLAAIIPAVLTFIGTLLACKKSQISKNTEEIKKLARQLGVNDNKTFHSEFSEQYDNILNEVRNNIGKTPNDKALTGQHNDIIKIIERDFEKINSRYEKEDESYRTFTNQQRDLKDTLDNFSRDYANVIAINRKLFNENIILNEENNHLQRENNDLKIRLGITSPNDSPKR
ncbi:MAG: hypothetical protein J6A69_11255 [Clostridia bacterium]|nr:hypothetical protein [Clostridia bacterium]